MIEQLIPAYVEATKSNHSYEILRSFEFDGHEVAWVDTTYYLNSDTDMEQPQHDYRVMCDCDFTEGIGWNLGENGSIYTVFGKNADACSYRPLALQQRRQELREHLEKVVGKNDNPSERESVLFIVKALEELVVIAKDHQMIEVGTGAHFWGGYFYLQSIQEILDVEWKHVHMAMAVLYRMKKLNQNGMVVVPYTEPPAPKWGLMDSSEVDGYRLLRSLPTHERMPHVWKLAIHRKSDDAVLAEVDLEIDYPLEFGVDQDDLIRSENKLKEMLAALTNTPPTE